MHSRKSRRALDLDLRTNSLESRQLLATPTATVAIYHRSINLTKTALVLGAQQYIVWPTYPLSAKVTLTKPLTVHAGHRVDLHNQYDVHRRHQRHSRLNASFPAVSVPLRRAPR